MPLETSVSPQAERRVPRRCLLLIGAIVSLVLVAPACSGGGRDGDGHGDSRGSSGGDTGEPVRGGELTYALEAETPSGWCIPETQLAISGMMVAWSVYDFLFVPGTDGFVPFLVESVESNDDDTEWILRLREGVTFHDGSALDAAVVKNNIDSWLGRYPNRKSLLGGLVLDNIDTVETVDDMTVEITTKVPWPALPAYLYGGGRSGIMAQAQLDDPDTCDRDLIGTGPYRFVEWEVGDHLTLERNPDYWRTDDDGGRLPYLDGITFRPVADSQTRVNGLLSGEYDIIMTSAAPTIEVLQAEAEGGNLELVQSSVNAEVGFIMFNEAQPPFDDHGAREAVATALDRATYTRVVSLGLLETASGPFPPGSPGHLDDAGFPRFDLDRARQLVQDYESRTGARLEFTYTHPPDEDNLRSAQFIQGQLEAAGMEVHLRPREQATLIETAIGGDWNAMAFRNFPGGYPDGNYLWWQSESPVNLGHIHDPELDALLDAGRSELDKEASNAIYQDVNRRLAQQVHFGWLNWSRWTIATRPGIEGIRGVTLPGGEQPTDGLATGHATSGIHLAG